MKTRKRVLVLAALTVVLAGCATPLVHENPVVRINVSATKGVFTGSGFVVSNEGHVVTNDHVVRPGDAAVSKVTVTVDPGRPNERTFPAAVVKSDEEMDLAVLKIHGKWQHLPLLPMGRSSDVAVGSSVRVQGFPKGGPFVETRGKVTKLLRPEEAEVVTGSVLSDARAVQGNSGGPLLSTNGKVVGVIVTSSWSRRVQEQKERMETTDMVARMVLDSLNDDEKRIRKAAQESGGHPVFGAMQLALTDARAKGEQLHNAFLPFLKILRKYGRFSCSIPVDAVVQRLRKWEIPFRASFGAGPAQ
ncbi:MAG: trypsin-like peptidase domain-containing protein [Lentisphaerae bacterium]|nr:trypsin-like peptidase domain-containing protein [Lentisphaerota bacterium]